MQTIYNDNTFVMSCTCIVAAVLVILCITVALRKRKHDDKEQLIRKNNSKNKVEDHECDSKHHYKYNFNKATNDFKTRYMKENDIEEEFAEGVVVNPLYSLQGEVVDNPTYLVSIEW